MSAIEDTISHISKTVTAMPTAILNAFPDLSSAGFVDIDRMGGTRFELGAMVGRSRVFEVDLNRQSVVPLAQGLAVPQSFDVSAALRVRYDAQGQSVRDDIKARAMREQIVIVKALTASDWPSVNGLVNLIVGQGTITAGTAIDDAGSNYDFIISEVVVDFSVDM